MWLTVPILTSLCTLRRPPARGAQATSCLFPGSKYSGKIWFLACSGDQEPLVIYALFYPSFPLQSPNRSKKTHKALDKIFTFISVLGEWTLKLFRIQRIDCNLFLEAWLENQTDLHGHLRRRRTLPTWRKKMASNIMKMDTRGNAQHSWFNVIFLATS